MSMDMSLKLANIAYFILYQTSNTTNILCYEYSTKLEKETDFESLISTPPPLNLKHKKMYSFRIEYSKSMEFGIFANIRYYSTIIRPKQMTLSMLFCQFSQNDTLI